MVTGELNFTKNGNSVQVRTVPGGPGGWVDIQIGLGLWLILTLEQARALKDQLNKEVV